MSAAAEAQRKWAAETRVRDVSRFVTNSVLKRARVRGGGRARSESAFTLALFEVGRGLPGLGQIGAWPAALTSV